MDIVEIKKNKKLPVQTCKFILYMNKEVILNMSKDLIYDEDVKV